MSADVPALALRGITKRFGDVVANDEIDLVVARGEIRALLGENGAGKSTLMRVLYGLEKADEGEIHLAGERVRLGSPNDAIAAGIGMVHQHFMLFPSLSVAENVVFGAEPRRLGLIDRGLIDHQAAADAVDVLAARFGLEVDPAARVGELAVGVRQRVEILKALYRDAEILILDEPTAVLTPAERDSLFDVLRQLATAGRTILFITHKLREVMAVADRATVLRHGAVVDTVAIPETSLDALSRLMVGGDLPTVVRGPRTTGPMAPDRAPAVTAAALEVSGLRVESRRVQPSAPIDFAIRAGEIVGIAGVAGNGQRALIETLVGLRPVAAGRVALCGTDVTRASIAERRALGLAYVPEDRAARGLALDATIRDNLLLGVRHRAEIFERNRLVRATAAEHVRRSIERFDVQPPAPARLSGTLSGGNQQKVVLARELADAPRLLIAEQPTRGVDIKAAAEIHRRLVDLGAGGGGVLLVSAETSELIALADRILVMYEGRVVGEVAADEANESQLGWLAGGGDAAA